MASELFTSTIGNRSARKLEESLSAFAHRFPVSGRIVHAIAQESGGVLGLAERLEKSGIWKDIQTSTMTGKASVMPPDVIREVFDSQTIDSVARTLGVPPESVEIQAALGIPKFFTSLAQEDDEDLGLGYSTRKGKKKSSAKASDTRRGAPPSH